MTEQEQFDPDVVLKDAHESSRQVHDNYLRSRWFLVNDMVPRWVESYKSYRSFVEIDEDFYQSNLFRPLIFGAVETFLPRLVMNLPRIEVWGRNKDDELRADRNRALLFYDWDALNMAFQLVNWAKMAQVFGIGWAKVVHKKEMRMRRRKKPRGLTLGGQFFQLPGFTKKAQLETVWDDPFFDLLDPDEVFLEPEAKSLERSRYAIHRTIVSLKDLEAARAPGGDTLYKDKVLAKLKKMAQSNPLDSDVEHQSIDSVRRTEFQSSGWDGSSDPMKIEVHLLEQWTDSKVTTVIEEFPQLEPIRDDYHDYAMKPFVGYTPIPLMNEIYGLSTPEVLLAINLEINTLSNARVDALLQNVYRMMSIIHGTINPDNLIWRPGGSFFVGSHEDYQFVKPPPVEFGMHRETDDLRMWSQWAIGATDTFAGLNTGLTGGTATEASLLNQAAASRAGLMFQILGTQALRPLGRLLVRINEEHIDQDKQIRVAGDYFEEAEYLTVKPEDLISKTGVDLDVIIDVAETEPGNRQFRMARATAAIQSLQNYLPPNHPLIERFLAELARSFGVEKPEQAIQQGREIAAQFSQQQLPPGAEATAESIVGADAAQTAPQGDILGGAI